MIPQRIVEYLDKHQVPYERHLHRRVFTAQELAAVMHVPGRRVAKSVIVGAGGKTWIAVLAATEAIDQDLLAALLGVGSVRLLHEAEFEHLFPDCEPGAEPPFGGLFGLPIIVDSALTRADRVVFRAGSHEEAIEMLYDDFHRLENGPKVGTFGRVPDSAPRLWEEWPEPTVP